MNDFPFEEDEYCDECGTKGAYDFYGDYLCHDCLKKENKKRKHEQKQEQEKEQRT